MTAGRSDAPAMPVSNRRERRLAARAARTDMPVIPARYEGTALDRVRTMRRTASAVGRIGRNGGSAGGAQ